MGSARVQTGSWIVVGVLALAAGMGGVVIMGACATGRAGAGATDTLQRSPQWQEGRFRNALQRQDGPKLEMLTSFLRGTEGSRPESYPPLPALRQSDFATPPVSGLRLTWLGHSTTLVEIDGRRLLLDPIWSERASPVSWAGPRRFHPVPLPLEELPPLDAVVLSHDHYDHLDEATIRLLGATVPRFIVPLGVGAHLREWDIPADRIEERDWWGEVAIGDVTLVATPARHFSGRSPLPGGQDQTLWSGWAMRGPVHRVYYSGDTAMFPGFAEIGRRLGPFDATLIEVGAYNRLWADVHIGPEQAVEAVRAAQGGLLVPVHWGTFELAPHGWTEPVERVWAAATANNLAFVTPRPGQRFEPATPPSPERWWPALPWRRAAEMPVVAGVVGGGAPSGAPTP